MGWSGLFSVLCFWVALGAAVAAGAPAADGQRRYVPELQGFECPWPVSYFSFTSQGEALRMAYMDVQPTASADGKTVVLLHGKNFCAATWQDTITVLTEAGYRVIAIDQIGFCKSSKPPHYQFSFQQLAGNTHALLASLGITRATICWRGSPALDHDPIMLKRMMVQMLRLSMIFSEDRFAPSAQVRGQAFSGPCSRTGST
jgi:pimeloyl-ACP methyl ester carboxylesterase